MKLLGGYLAMINVIALGLMAADKWKAARGKRRVPERTLFLAAIIGGSIGMLAGMYLCHHKTRKAKFRIGIPFILALQIVLGILLARIICQPSESPAQVVRRELALLNANDSDTIEAILQGTSLEEGAAVSPETETLHPAQADPARSGFWSAFFDRFSYEIASSQIDGSSAEVFTNITTFDTRSLAHDVRLFLTKEGADPRRTPNVLSQEAYYALLQDHLERGSYDLVTRNVTFHLEKQGKTWEIAYDSVLEDALLGGLVSNLKDPYLLSAAEVLACYLDAFRQFDAEDWAFYLGVTDLFSTYSPDYADAIDTLYMESLADAFSVTVLSCEEHANTATARLRVTSLDLTPTLRRYHELLLDYAGTTESITSDSLQLANASAAFLCEAMQEALTSTDYEVSLTLHHNGDTWIPSFDDSVTGAFLGNISGALEEFRAFGENNGNTD